MLAREISPIGDHELFARGVVPAARPLVSEDGLNEWGDQIPSYKLAQAPSSSAVSRSLASEDSAAKVGTAFSACDCLSERRKRQQLVEVLIGQLLKFAGDEFAFAHVCLKSILRFLARIRKIPQINLVFSTPCTRLQDACGRW